MANQFSKEHILEIFRSHSWSVQRFNALPLYITATASTGASWVIDSVLNQGYTHFFWLFWNQQAAMYYDEADWEAISECYFQEVTSLKTLAALKKQYLLRYIKACRLTAHDTAKLKGYPTDDLVALLARLCRRITEANNIAHAIEGINFGSERRLRAILQDKSVFSPHIFSVLCTPNEPSFLTEAQKELVVIKNLTDSEQEAAIAAFIERYGWIENTYSLGRVLTPSEIKTRLNRLEDRKGDNGVAELLREKKQLLSKINFSPAERFIIDTIAFCFHWQDDRKANILRSIGLAEPVLQELATRLGVESRLLKFLLPSELTVANLTTKEFIAALLERSHNCALYNTPHSEVMFSGDEYRFFSTALATGVDMDADEELKGIVASRGCVTGPVRVCFSISDIGRLEPGEILVASMTRPEYLSAMQRAGGFITDEGGVTCHAAIVSREMKKPCVIGTRVATKVLKNGQIVELNAEEGVIRVLK